MITLCGYAALFFACGIAILWKQASAQSCPAHCRSVGRWAVAIAALSILTGGGIVALALFWSLHR